MSRLHIIGAELRLANLAGENDHVIATGVLFAQLIRVNRN